MKLNQVLAVGEGVKTRVQKEVSQAYQVLGKPAPFSGLIRTYRPKDEEGEELPSESTLVQLTVEDLIGVVTANLTDLFDITATKEWTNTTARADVKLDDGTVILSSVPVTYLLFLEKQLTDLHTFVSSLPILDPSQRWEIDESMGTGVWRSEVKETHKTSKVPRAFVKYEATEQHPAQVDVVHEDVIQGFWSATNYSGAIRAARRQELVDRVRRLQRAVKFAREEANNIDADQQHPAGAIFGFVFGP